MQTLALLLLLTALVLFLVAAYLHAHPIHGRLVALGLACLAAVGVLLTLGQARL